MADRINTLRITTIGIAGVCLLLLVAAGFWWSQVSLSSLQADRERLRQLMLQNEYEASLVVADRYLRQRPDDAEVQRLAAEAALKTNAPSLAVAYLQQISLAETAEDAEVLSLLADLHLNQLFSLQEAASYYRQALQRTPDDVEVLSRLARLYAVCGRRRDAIPLILRMVQLNAASDLLLVAARPSGAINDEVLLNTARQKHPDDPLMLTGLALLAARNDQPALAIQHCKQAVRSNPDDAAAVVLQGKFLLQQKDFDALQRWQMRLDQTHENYAETWRVRAYLAEQRGDLQQALAHFLKAAKLGPDLKDVHHRIAQLLFAAGYDKAAQQFSKRLQEFQQLEAAQDRVLSGGGASAENLLALVHAFHDTGRSWEAYGWSQLALQSHSQNQPLAEVYQQLQTELVGQPVTLVKPSRNVVARFQSSDFQLEERPPSDELIGSSDQATKPPAEIVQLRNDANAAGFQFRYQNGVSGATEHRMYELTGGGIGVGDFDHDGAPDLFCSQGSLWSERETAAAPADQIFLNRQGRNFVSTGSASGISESSFGQGVAVGDVNEDGFADVLVANFGTPVLWLNLGDGTFAADQSLAAATEDLSGWWTSALIADLDGNVGADVYIVGYLAGSDLAERVCPTSDGRIQSCPPTLFDGVANRLLINQADGTFRDASGQLIGDEDGKSLGVLAWSPNSDGQTAVLVANDTTPNHVFTMNDSGAASDQGFAFGLATNFSGKSEGCMGIAAADLNRDGRCEVFVTNFLNESNTLYEPVADGFYQDATDRWKLTDASLPVLGFGTQFLDGNLDGLPELFVANGHVDDLRLQNKPYRMPAQIFAVSGRRFREVTSQQTDDYFQQNHLGRAVARLDWNLDGQPDLAVGHLLEPYALLSTVADRPGRFLQLQLIGRDSARDAVGATVTCRIDGELRIEQLTAGDGYQCSNERVLTFGCGQTAEVEDVAVIWPGGARQMFGNLATGVRYVLVQDRSAPLQFPK